MVVLNRPLKVGQSVSLLLPVLADPLITDFAADVTILLSACASSSTSTNPVTPDKSADPQVILDFLQMTAGTLRSAVAARGGRVKDGNKRKFAEFLRDQGVDPATLTNAHRVTNPNQKCFKRKSKVAVRSDTEMLTDDDESQQVCEQEGDHLANRKQPVASTSGLPNMFHPAAAPFRSLQHHIVTKPPPSRLSNCGDLKDIIFTAQSATNTLQSTYKSANNRGPVARKEGEREEQVTEWQRDGDS